ncbi:MAG: TldD/PmbA family protein [Gloeomargaritaceae cyanobacterium C42_A2020_066]|nr:TldD/PmbA family protein [Gloeomargaritaceae cyanobacterium C42_A2020_066]
MVELDVLEKILQLAAGRTDSAEVYYLSSQGRPVQFENNRLKSLETRALSGVALRVIAAGRMGFASSTDLTRLEDLVEAAVQTATIGEPAEISFAEQTHLSQASPEVVAPANDDLVAAGEALIAQVHAYNPEILVDVGFNLQQGRVAILTSGGSLATHQSQYLSTSLSGNLVRGEDFLQIYTYQVTGGEVADYESLVQNLIRKYTWAETTTAVSARTLPVLLTPRAVAGVLGGLFETILSGQAIVQQASPLVGKLGETLFDPRFTLREDPTLGLAARAFDDEATPTQVKALIEAGTVQGFYWDRLWAARAGEQSTGNGYRGGLSRPGPELANLVIDRGVTPYADLIRSMDEGLIVDQVLGAGQSNQLAGEFSVNLDLGYRVVQGEIVGRVKNTMVAGNIFEAFQAIRDFSLEQEWVGASVLTPAILFDQLGIAAG